METDLSRLEVRLRDVPQLENVDLPCFVGSSATGLALLGGEDTLSASIAKRTSVQFRFPTENKCSPNLVGSSVDSNGLLIRIRRKKSDSSVSVSAVGVVKRSITFNEPADYQFLPSCSSASYYQTEEAAEHPILETLPSMFSRAIYAPGAFLSLTDNLKIPDEAPPRKSVAASSAEAGEGSDEEENADAEEAGSASRSAKKRHPDQGLTSFIRFGDPIPQSHAQGEYPPRWKGKPTTFRGYHLLARIRQVFDVIPMLTQPQVQGMLNIEPQNLYLFQDCLHYAAYCFSQGPYRGLWVRFGYDPAQHPEARLFQTFVFRLSPVVLQDVSRQVSDHIGTTDCILDLDTLTVKEAPLPSSSSSAGSAGILSMFGIPLKTQFTVQLYLLSHPSLLEFISRLSPTRQGTGKEGWFSPSQVAELRSLVLKCITDSIEQFLSSPPVVVKRRLGSLVDQATLTSFDPAEVTRYLHAEDDDGMEGSSAFEPSPMLQWMRRYQRALAREDSQYAVESEVVGFIPSEAVATPAKTRVVKPVKKAPAAKAAPITKPVPKQPPSANIAKATAVSSKGGSSSGSNSGAKALEKVTAFHVFGDDDDDDDDGNDMDEEEEEEEEEEEAGAAVELLHSDSFAQANRLLQQSDEERGEVNDFMSMVKRLKK